MKHLLFLCACLLSCLSTNAGTVAILRDGPGDWYFEAQADQMIAELEDLMAGNELKLKPSQGDWTNEGIREQLTAALNDPEVDVVYAAGAVASMIAQSLPDPERTKPIFGGAVHYSNLGDYPLTADGGSAIPNFAFITQPQRASADCALLIRLAQPKKLVILIDELIYQHVPHLDNVVKGFEHRLGVPLVFIKGHDTAASYLDQLPADTTAAYVSLLGRLNTTERTNIYQVLAEKNIVNVSMAGEPEMALGPMACLASDSRKAVARRIAIGLYQLLQGGNTESLPVLMASEDRLLINMQVGSRIGWSPDYDTALEASFLGASSLLGGEELTLQKAMFLASQRNRGILIAQENLKEQEAVADATGSNLRPKLSLVGQASQTGLNSPIDPNSPEEITSTSYGVELTQILYNDDVRSATKAARQQTEASRYAAESARLDAMEQAGLAFLQLALNQSLHRIQQENLRLTENNLRLARLRNTIGTGDQAEVFRWETTAAQDRTALVQQDGQVRDALATLNQVLGLPQEKVWSPKEISLAEDEFFFMNDVVTNRFDTFAAFQNYRGFLLNFAKENAPELSQFDALIDAQDQLLRTSKRQRYVPEVSAHASWSQQSRDTDLSSRDDQDEWIIGAQASLPLWEGGNIDADVRAQTARLNALTYQRTQAEEFVAQQAVSAWNGIASLHPSIRLNRRGRDAAEKSYFAAREKFTRGTATNLDLLDAQAQLLNQQRQAEQTFYAYLSNSIQLQRILAFFEYEATPEEIAEWTRALDQHLQQAD